MKKTFCLIFAAVLSLLSMTVFSQNLTTEGPFCRQLVGSGIYAVRMSIEVTEDGYLRISLTRAYSENIQAKPSFDFDREWKILNPTSSQPAGMLVKSGMAGVIVSDLENGQSITITKDHELLRGAWTKNGYMTLLEIPYKIGTNISTLTSNYLPSFPFDHDKMQCSSVSAIITSETDLLSLCVGSEVTLNAEGFDGNGNFVWERSDSPDGPWEEIPGQNASSIKIVSKNGNEYFKVSQNGTESEPFMLTSVPCCQYTDEERKLWSEDFGTVPKGTRECCEYVKNHTCSRTPSTEIPDGQFAVVSNSDDALDLDGTIYNWARNKTDHTGNPDGGFLVVNIGQPVLFYEQEIERDFCENQWYHLSIFACNISQSSGHQAAEFRFEVATADGQVLAEGETGPLQDWEMENWTNYGISFNSGNYNKFIIRLYSVGGAVNGNDVAIDDMSISVCSPQINLYADIDAGLTDATVDCGSDLTLSITGSDEYLHSIYSNPYVLWQKSTDEGATWTSMEGSGIMVSEMTVTKDDPSVTDYYRAILAGSRELAEEAAATGTLSSDCEVFSISNMVRVDCQRVCKVTISASDETPCEGEEITLTASPGSFDSYDWTGPGVSGNGNSQTVIVNEETTYKVSANGPGCITEESSITITPVKKPAGTKLTATANEICSGESVTLAATASNADKYELFANGISISYQEENEWQISPVDGENTYKVIAYNQSCAGETDEVKITVHSPIEIGLQTESLTVCKGAEAELAATVITGEPTRYFWNGEESPNPHVFTADHDMTVEVFAENDFCKSEPVTASITVQEPVKITLPAIDDICQGESISITAVIDGSHDGITWYESDGNGDFVQIPGENGITLETTPQRNGDVEYKKYKISVTTAECPETGATTGVYVHEPIGIALSDSNPTVCEGSEATLAVSTITGEPTRYFWNGEEGPNPHVFTADHDMTVEVFAENDFCKSEPVTASITVQEPVKITLPAIDDICQGESISITAVIDGSHDGITWYESDGNGDFVQIPGENGITLETTPQRNGDVEYKKYKISVTTAECPETGATTGVYVHEPIKIALSDSNPTVCEGSEATLAVSTITGNPTRYFWNGAEASDTYTFTAGNDMTIEVYSENDFCKSEPVTASITVQKPVKITLPAIDDICQGESISITAVIDGSHDGITWYESDGNGDFVQIPGENGTTLETTPQRNGDVEYKISVTTAECPETGATTGVYVHEPIEIALSDSNPTVCEGSEATLAVSTITGNPTRYFWNGAEASDTYTFTAGNDMTIEVYSENDFCKSEPVTASITVQEPVKITLPAIDDICQGESISITAVIDGSHDGITWYESDGNGDFVQIPGENGITLETTPQRNGDVEYKISVTTAECPETGATTGVYVHEPIEIALSDSNPTVCEGSEATLAVSTITGNPTRYFWNGAEASDTYTFTASNDMTIEVYSENDFCKSNIVTAAITVQEPVNVTLPELDDICFGDEINIAADINGDYDDIVWTVSTNGNDFSTITGENGDRLSVTPLQTGKAEYGIEVSSRICGTASDFATLNVNEVPEILQIADNAASEGFVSLVIGNGTPPYSVFLNGQSYGTNTNPGGLQPNTHYNVEISDANGCMAYGEFRTPGMPIDIPLFFSPNGDGINDAWKVDNLETYHGAAIEIYDRFGRKLCTLNADDDGWDGTYNGHDMPMDDYWYIILIPEENRRLSGHFTLKR